MNASLLDFELMAIEKDLGRFLIKDDKMVATTLTRIFGDSRGRSKMGNLGQMPLPQLYIILWLLLVKENNLKILCNYLPDQ